MPHGPDNCEDCGRLHMPASMHYDQAHYFFNGPDPTRDPFTDPESLVITYRGARLALYYVDGDNNGGEYIAVGGSWTPEIAGDLLDELDGLPVLARDRLESYFGGPIRDDEPHPERSGPGANGAPF